ncbi:hypothetical protein KC323_g238 [Hortaea werneckii]|nr:hypothetical protein KC323_g238 [Hortaea werneckii]KAI7360188.1 hypothetical protein KC320_g184 [Hortaea werneckii]
MSPVPEKKIGNTGTVILKSRGCISLVAVLPIMDNFAEVLRSSSAAVGVLLLVGGNRIEVVYLDLTQEFRFELVWQYEVCVLQKAFIDWNRPKRRILASCWRECAAHGQYYLLAPPRQLTDSSQRASCRSRRDGLLSGQHRGRQSLQELFCDP